jgi:hypothetical protein
MKKESYPTSVSTFAIRKSHRTDQKSQKSFLHCPFFDTHAFHEVTVSLSSQSFPLSSGRGVK